MKRFASIVALALLAVAPGVFAQTVNAAATLDIDWALPTTGCVNPPSCTQNVPLTGAYALTGVKLYVSTSPIADNSTMAPSAVLGAGVIETSYNLTVANGSTVYVRVKATNASGDSPFSSEVSKVVNVPARPGAPTGVTVNLTITP